MEPALRKIALKDWKALDRQDIVIPPQTREVGGQSDTSELSPDVHQELVAHNNLLI